ncbi:MAG: hypothetical protein LBH93_01365 [Chitinispirillales bacterium]|jgi:type II secretory pathway pseudopilin PulG|nr:hypothetical protein [Chitinispirillales bacterium]
MEQNVGNKGVAGVSIVEILISMVLVAIALVAVTTVFPSMNKNRKGIYEADQARMLATEALEGLQLYSTYSDNSCGLLASGSHDSPEGVGFCNSFHNKNVPMGSTTYKVAWEINCGAASGGGSLNTADVTVEWTKGKPHKITLSGILQ